eukprot:563342-Hanusia_phi.AAC.3
MTWLKDTQVGAAVGVTDVAFVYPLAVLATRREAGMSMKAALSQGRLWAGGWTAGTLLIPYSIGVETLSNGVRRTTTRMLGMEEDSMVCQVAAAAATSGVITFLGLQPIEKKMVSVWREKEDEEYERDGRVEATSHDGADGDDDGEGDDDDDEEEEEDEDGVEMMMMMEMMMMVLVVTLSDHDGDGD